MKPHIEMMVNKAIEDGKIRPDQKLWALDYAEKDYAGFHVFVSKAPAIPRVPDRFLADTRLQAEIDETQRMINSLCGIDEETFEKYSMGQTAGRSKATDAEIEASQAMINKMCGVDDETFKKYGPRG